MKYKTQDYAKALAAVAAESPLEQDNSVIKNFLAVVQKNGDMRRIGKITELAEKILMKKSNRSKWTIESARPLKNVRELFKNLVKSTDLLEEKISSDIVAGVKITRDDEEQFDATLKTKLGKLFS
jgi:F0F1-type ATP synthase delta subunit